MRLGDLDNLKRRVKKSTVSALLKAGIQVFIETEEIIDPEDLPLVKELREQLAKVTAERDTLKMNPPVKVESDDFELALQLAEVTAERDALLKEFAGECGVCANYEKCRNNPCYCINGNMWEWRGLDK